jgi:hypothetical protein
VDSATATASALAELLVINGLEAPALVAPGASADSAVTHRQLTTGDVDRFTALSTRLFGAEMPAAAAIELGVAA